MLLILRFNRLTKIISRCFPASDPVPIYMLFVTRIVDNALRFLPFVD